MKKILHIPILILSFLSFGISNAGFGEWKMSFYQGAARYFLARATEHVPAKNEQYNNINSPDAQHHKDRYGSDSADAEYTQRVHEALQAMGEKRWSEVPVYRLKDDLTAYTAGGTTDCGIWLGHGSSAGIDPVFTVYHESAHWVANDFYRRSHAIDSFDKTPLPLAFSIAGFLATVPFIFGENNSLNDVMVSFVAATYAFIIIPPFALIVHSRMRDRMVQSIKQEIERCADTQAATTLCCVGRSDIVQERVDKSMEIIRASIAKHFKLDINTDKERIDSVLLGRLAAASQVDSLDNSDHPVLWEKTNNLMRILAEHRAQQK